MSELKPCPFCGGYARTVLIIRTRMVKWHSVHCQSCGAGMLRSCETEEEAIAAWNRRAVKSCVECKHYPPAKEDGSEAACPMWDNGDDGWGSHWNGDEFGFCHKWEAKE